MTVTKDDQGRLNNFAIEPTMYPVDHNYRPMIAWDARAEILNARFAMLGIVAGAISYALTGKLFFGLY
jgi:hypothetical protein